MEGPSSARLYATLVAGGLVVLGIVGFFYGASFGSPGEVDEMLGAFALNGWLNTLYIASGAIGLLLAGYAARGYALGCGLFYVAVAVWGFAIGGDGEILSIFPVDTAGNLLHLALGALGLAAWAGTPARDRRPTPTRSPTPPTGRKVAP